MGCLLFICLKKISYNTEITLHTGIRMLCNWTEDLLSLIDTSALFMEVWYMQRFIYCIFHGYSKREALWSTFQKKKSPPRPGKKYI